MITLFREEQTFAPHEILDVCRNRIMQLTSMVSAIGCVHTVLRFEFSCENIRPLVWLHNQIDGEKVYWSDRDSGQEMAGVGHAHIIAGEGEVDYDQVLDDLELSFGSDNDYIRFYGGFCFSNPKDSPDWREFGSYRFVIPRFELCRRESGSAFAVNIRIAEINEAGVDQIVSELEQINFDDFTEYRNVPRKLSRVDLPGFAEWSSNIDSMTFDKACKVVLARKSDFAFHIPIRPSALINFLKEQSPGCFHFCFQPLKNIGFLGAPPERLFRLKDDVLLTEALAGTTGVGQSSEEKQMLADKMLGSSKCRQEQQYVVDHLSGRLKNICSDFDMPSEPQVMSLKNVQHLYSPVQGRLKEGKSRADVLRELHPTPAVCGVPAGAAAELIRSYESFERGWYAGPVGYVGRHSCEFAVGIRSGLVRKYILSLYSGAGIVDGSTALEEWSEIEMKIARFMKVFA